MKLLLPFLFALVVLAPQDQCGILTAADLKAAGIDRVMETTCMKELHLLALLGKERGFGALYLVVGDAETPRAKTAYEQDVKDYKELGKDAFKEENLFGEKSYRAQAGDDIFLGFLKGKHYFKWVGGGETPAEKKESEDVARKLAKSCASRF